MEANLKQRAASLAKWLAIILVVILISGISIFALMQTPWGRAQAAHQLAQALIGEDWHVQLGEVNGVFPVSVRLDEVGIGDENGQWLILEDVSIRWVPFSLIQGQIHFSKISARRLALERLPQVKDRRDSGKIFSMNRLASLQWVRIDHFGIKHLDVAKSVVGEPIGLQTEGYFMTPLEKDGLYRTELRLHAAEDQNARVLVRVRHGDEAGDAYVDAKVGGALGNVLAKIMGLPGPLDVTVKGEGLLEHWSGRVGVREASMGSLEGDVALQLTDEVKLQSKGHAEISSEQIPPSLRPWLQNQVPFTMEIRWRPEARLSLDSLEITTPHVNLHLAGSLDLRRQLLQASLAGQFANLKPVSDVTGLSLKGNGKLEVELQGPAHQPRGTIFVTTGPLETEALTAERVETNIQIEFADPWQGSFPRVRLSSTGTITGLRLPGSGLEGSPIQWDVVGEGPADDSFRIRSLKLMDGAGTVLEAQGLIYLETLGASFQGTAKVSDFRQYAPVTGLELPAGADLSFQIGADFPEKPLQARFRGNLQVLDSAHPSFALLGREASYSGSILLSKERMLLIPELTIQSGTLSLGADGLVDFPSHTASVSFRLHVPELGSIPYFSSRKLSGPAQAEGKVEQNRDVFSVRARFESPRLQLQGIDIERISATLESEGQLPLHHQGQLEAVFSLRAGHEIRGEAQFGLSNQGLRLSPVRLEGLETRLKGSVAVDFGDTRTHGDFESQFADLSQLSAITGRELAGKLAINGEFDISRAGERVDWNLDGQDLSMPYGKVHKLLIAGYLTELSKVPKGTVSLEGKEMRLGDLLLDRLRFDAASKGDLSDIVFALQTAGKSQENFQLSTEGTLTYSPTISRIRFTHLEGAYGMFPIALVRPSLLEITKSSITLDETSVILGEGMLSASINLENNMLQLEAHLDEIPLEALPQKRIDGLKGFVSGTIQLAGSSISPQGEMDVEISQLEWNEQRLQDISHSDLKAKASLRKDNLALEIYLEGLAPEPFRVHLNLPVECSVAPLRWKLLRDGKIDGEITGPVDLSRIPLVLALENQKVTGQARVDLSLRGTVQSPGISGLIELENGTYENAHTGTSLKEIILTLRAEGEKVHLEQVRATDGNKGIIQAQGWISQSISKGLPFQLSFSLQDAELLHHDYVSVRTDGDLAWAGNISESRVEGVLEIQHAELNIPSRLPTEITELEVREINLRGQESPKEQQKKDRQGHNIDLDIRVVSAGQIFLRGRGVNSEWSGDIMVGGNLVEPVLTGGLSTVRGHVNFLGKKFTIVHGFLDFPGGTPPNPQIDILGEAKTKEITATLALSGDFKAPQVEISSEPPMPSDEVLSHLLFGKSVSSLNAPQALQLAQAVNTLTGEGELDLTGRTRELLGLDQLTVTSEGASVEEAELLAGKYLTDKIYLEVERGITPLSGKVSLEFQLTPNIWAVTEIWENSAGGIGLNWKWDY